MSPNICEYCRSPVEQGDGYCIRCGAPLSPIPSASSENQEKKSVSKSSDTFLGIIPDYVFRIKPSDNSESDIDKIELREGMLIVTTERTILAVPNPSCYSDEIPTDTGSDGFYSNYSVTAASPDEVLGNDKLNFSISHHEVTRLSLKTIFDNGAGYSVIPEPYAEAFESAIGRSGFLGDCSWEQVHALFITTQKCEILVCFLEMMFMDVVKMVEPLYKQVNLKVEWEKPRIF